MKIQAKDLGKYLQYINKLTVSDIQNIYLHKATVKRKAAQYKKGGGVGNGLEQTIS